MICHVCTSATNTVLCECCEEWVHKDCGAPLFVTRDDEPALHWLCYECHFAEGDSLPFEEED